ncbi:MAG: YaaA family protein, partial [Oscillospiraceae bacterium]
MRIIISPAKKMNADTDSLPWEDLPQFLPQTEVLLHTLQGMDHAALQALWGCNDTLAALNIDRLRQMDLWQNLTPALLCYEGIQYRYMAPGVFEDGQFQYAREHLRILSGFYGLLRPFDGVTPYRLELQARLAVGDCRNLYDFWGGRLARQLCNETDVIVNLASKEYSQAVAQH